MSAMKVVEMAVVHTQHASYYEGQRQARAEAMRLVRQIKQRLDTQGALSAAAYEELTRLEETLYGGAMESSGKVTKHYLALATAAEGLKEADPISPPR